MNHNEKLSNKYFKNSNCRKNAALIDHFIDSANRDTLHLNAVLFDWLKEALAVNIKTTELIYRNVKIKCSTRNNLN